MRGDSWRMMSPAWMALVAYSPSPLPVLEAFTTTVISFISEIDKTRATKSTEEDWLKLKRVLEYLKRNKKFTLTLGADSLGTLHGYVDAAYGVHQDGKGHTGGMITFGRGALMT